MGRFECAGIRECYACSNCAEARNQPPQNPLGISLDPRPEYAGMTDNLTRPWAA
jgi:hypothetical protein